MADSDEYQKFLKDHKENEIHLSDTTNFSDPKYEKWIDEVVCNRCLAAHNRYCARNTIGPRGPFGVQYHEHSKQFY